MTTRAAVLNVVGLSTAVLGDDAPFLSGLARARTVRALRPVLPAVTCSVQASMLTGRPVSAHGIVANGWYEREQAEVRFWKQSNRLVRAPKVWETARARDPSCTSANLFWWFAMHSSADVTVTPRPMYPADGRKIPDVWTSPSAWRDDLQRELGPFPLFSFWGPNANIASTRWIAEAAKRVHDRAQPTLQLVYLPHLDYGLQKLGPGHPGLAAEIRAVDAVVRDLVTHLERDGVRTIVVSEYGIEPAVRAVRPNLALRDAGLLALRPELGREMLDPGESRAFAVCDHQVAHVYVRDGDDLARTARVLGDLDGVAEVLDRPAQDARGIAHERGGDLVLVAAPQAWFAYPWWHDDARAPDYARTVDIHRKPGYDPCELFLDPALAWPRGRIGWTLLKRRLGFRSLLDVIPLDASLVRGTHGRDDAAPEHRPLVVAHADLLPPGDTLPCTAVHDLILRALDLGA